jgi:GrpB-like predicted nucleotidyltransferase (UPF0157 family)
MLRPIDITTFNDSPPPPGESVWVSGQGPTTEVRVEVHDPSWPARYELIAGRIRTSLGAAVLALDHVGSTSVPGLDAKPIIDVDLTVSDGAAEASYVPALAECGFRLAIREPWWYGHRLLRGSEPACNLHVWSPDCPEPVRHVIFRDWLRANPDECEVYVRAKRAAAAQTLESGGDGEAYNARKQAVIRQIYGRAFIALGLA